MEYNDNKNSIPQDNGLAIHQYRMGTDPVYRAKQRIVTEDKPLEDSSLDLLMFASPGSQGLAKMYAGNSGRKIAIPIDTGRRSALKTIRDTAIVASTLPSVANMFTTKAASIAKKADGVNLAELAKQADEFKDIRYAAGTIDKLPKNKEAAAVIQKARDSAVYLQGKYPLDYSTSAGSAYHNAASKIFDQLSRKDEYVKFREAKGLPVKSEKLAQYDEEVQRIKDVLGISANDLAHLDNIVNKHRVVSNAENSINQLKHTRDSALSTKDPVLDLPSIKAERLRTVNRIKQLEKAPDKQDVVVYNYDEFDRPIDSMVDYGVTNAAKVDKMNYLQTRLSNIDAQLDALSTTGKHTPIQKLDSSQLNKHNARKEDIWQQTIDSGPY